MAHNDISVPVQSNKFVWCSYHLPPLSETDNETECDEEDAVEFPDNEKDSDDTRKLPSLRSDSFTLRHLKQGRTGAVKTWPAAQVLLDYLVRRGGLRGVREKLSKNCPADEASVLDLTVAPSLKDQRTHQPALGYNILELGAGSGYLGIGLALSLNKEACQQRGPFQPKIRVLCTDHDKNTVKNMRYNVSQQPKSKLITKAVRVQALDWGKDVGGNAFSQAVEAQFGGSKRINQMNEAEQNDDNIEYKDPIIHFTHLVASDVLFGEATLEPLSDVIAAIKLRNPSIRVTILQRERSPGHVAELKKAIESKVQNDLLLLKEEDLSPERQRHKQQKVVVSVRDVVHEEIGNLKVMEC